MHLHILCSWDSCHKTTTIRYLIIWSIIPISNMRYLSHACHILCTSVKTFSYLLFQELKFRTMQSTKLFNLEKKNFFKHQDFWNWNKKKLLSKSKLLNFEDLQHSEDLISMTNPKKNIFLLFLPNVCNFPLNKFQ